MPLIQSSKSPRPSSVSRLCVYGRPVACCAASVTLTPSALRRFCTCRGGRWLLSYSRVRRVAGTLWSGGGGGGGLLEGLGVLVVRVFRAADAESSQCACVCGAGRWRSKACPHHESAAQPRAARHVEHSASHDTAEHTWHTDDPTLRAALTGRRPPRVPKRRRRATRRAGRVGGVGHLLYCVPTPPASSPLAACGARHRPVQQAHSKRMFKKCKTPPRNVTHGRCRRWSVGAGVGAGRVSAPVCGKKLKQSREIRGSG